MTAFAIALQNCYLCADTVIFIAFSCFLNTDQQGQIGSLMLCSRRIQNQVYIQLLKANQRNSAQQQKQQRILFGKEAAKHKNGRSTYSRRLYYYNTFPRSFCRYGGIFLCFLREIFPAFASVCQKYGIRSTLRIFAKKLSRQSTVRMHGETGKRHKLLCTLRAFRR